MNRGTSARSGTNARQRFLAVEVHGLTAELDDDTSRRVVVDEPGPAGLGLAQLGLEVGDRLAAELPSPSPPPAAVGPQPQASSNTSEALEIRIGPEPSSPGRYSPLSMNNSTSRASMTLKMPRISPSSMTTAVPIFRSCMVATTSSSGVLGETM
jgi:hypothetical protein